MKRSAHFFALGIGLLVGVCGMAGCERQESAAPYDAKIDSLLPTYYKSAPDTGILDDQRTVFAKLRDANAAAHPAPASAPATAPATAPEPGSPPAPPA